MEQIKTKLIELAKELGFGAVLMQNVAYKVYPDLEPTRYYLWMCELQKWCREKHPFILEILSYNDDEAEQTLWYFVSLDIKNGWDQIEDYTFYHSYEEALEEGLYQTLLLIQEENE